MTTPIDLKDFAGKLPPTREKMPVLFVGHGSPMNAIEENEFSAGWRLVGRELPRPAAILCISAHWETKGTFVTAMAKPRTIHDFGGFPEELYAVQYPAPGAPVLAVQTKAIVKQAVIELDKTWGLDHGCWSVVRRMFPEADIPVLQMSIDNQKSPRWHYELVKDLAILRSRGLLIIGSGNIVHNLRMIDWGHPDSSYDWAAEMNTKLKELILNGDHEKLTGYSALGRPAALAIPTPEHYIPMLYALGLKEENDEVDFFNDKTVMGSISMTSFKIA